MSIAQHCRSTWKQFVTVRGQSLSKSMLLMTTNKELLSIRWRSSRNGQRTTLPSPFVRRIASLNSEHWIDRTARCVWSEKLWDLGPRTSMRELRPNWAEIEVVDESKIDRRSVDTRWVTHMTRLVRQLNVAAFNIQFEMVMMLVNFAAAVPGWMNSSSGSGRCQKMLRPIALASSQARANHRERILLRANPPKTKTLWS